MSLPPRDIAVLCDTLDRLIAADALITLREIRLLIELHVLHDSAPATREMRTLQGSLRFPKGAVTRSADFWQERQCLERLPVPGDARSVELRLTPKGAAFATAALTYCARLPKLGGT